MKKNAPLLKEQFKNIKSVIETNIAAIKSLNEQSNGLETIITSMSNQDPTNDTKAKLEQIKVKIDEAIKTLTQETKELFVAFDKLVDELFY
ncbi:MAG: hypothetical protein O3A66_01345 [Proteobacteria bacterium]|jgi:predicted  nucleic acid-binding Zn-ribbon protein|nr:hypothetical protein [Pseudomonadota bacterium]